jgi:hypothetical protein
MDAVGVRRAMWVFRLVVANLIARLLWPLVWAVLAVLAVWFVVTVPARLWLLYIDPRADQTTLMALNWTTGIGFAAAWLLVKARRIRRR